MAAMEEDGMAIGLAKDQRVVAPTHVPQRSLLQVGAEKMVVGFIVADSSSLMEVLFLAAIKAAARQILTGQEEKQ